MRESRGLSDEIVLVDKQSAMAKGKTKRTPQPETFDALVNRLRAAVERAATWDEFQGARVAIRNALTVRQVEGTDLWAVCERKRLTFEGE